MFVVVVKFLFFFSCRHENGRERDFCLLFCFVCFFLLFFFVVSFHIKQIKQRRRRISLYCFIVSSFPNENDDDDDTTDFESF